jgi:hypothetical protein
MPPVVRKQGEVMAQGGSSNQKIEVAYQFPLSSQRSPKLAKPSANIRVNTKDHDT